MLAAAGWAVQDDGAVNLSAARGVAVREFVIAPPRARRLPAVPRRQRRGVIEAKKEGETLTGVEWQSGEVRRRPARRARAALSRAALAVRLRVDRHGDAVHEPARPGAGEPRGVLVPPARDARRLARRAAAPPDRRRRCATGSARCRSSTTTGLWPAQLRAIRNLEESLAANRPRALIQMATGSGKTFTAANVAYRLVKHADARRDPVPRRPGEPRPADAEGVPGLHHPGRRPQVHRALQRPAPAARTRSTRSARVDDLDDPAALLDPARRAGARRGARRALGRTS